MLEHGGRLLRAAREYGIAPEAWLDLSTGISPFAWPVPPIPAEAWHRLPEDDDGLIDVARAYYGTVSLLPVAGSQAAIQMLPMLRSRSRVGVLSPGYAEHAHAWEQAGHRVERCSAIELFARAASFDVIVLMHPNNPGGECFEQEQLLGLHAALAGRGGWLMVDEAFIDATPERSLCALPARPGLIVLRSIGKFFGLAGARAGFVSTTTDLLVALGERLGPWTLTGTTRHVLKLALADRDWHAQARERLHASSVRLAELLTRHGLPPSASSAFFQWCCDERAPSLQRALARQGVWVRRFETPASLRFGLPGDDAAFARLDTTLGLMAEAKECAP
ncbi:threonine-phosphate decarboxylase CobD [Dyella subtropica]|uniref:threonine-phosphate decarboxylase CobD n=1 Tax=Dyella subtropica TaxID=2992127 RepID=UPI00225BCF70|nr:threonine-phosphate decarboxylase CobD [Dyella subtropica]